MMEENSILTYSPYGHLLTPDSRLAFNGQWVDTFTQMYWLGLGYRAYSPSLARFHSPDSWSPFSFGGLNAYTYVGNDPVNYNDPTGHVRLFSKTKAFQGNARPVNGGHIYLAKHPEYKDRKAITAVYHGTEGSLTGLRGPISPSEFVQSIKNKAGLNFKEYDIHVIACHSGDAVDGNLSFIEAITTLTGRRAYGYSGTVNTSEKSFPISNRDVYYDTLIRTKLPSYARNKRDFNYRPVTAIPQQPIRDPDRQQTLPGR